MKKLIVGVVVFLVVLLTGCAATRVLVRDCQKLQGMDQQNCELVQKL